jgi:hypothetical protein
LVERVEKVEKVEKDNVGAENFQPAIDVLKEVKIRP